MVCDLRPAYGKTGQFQSSYDTQTVIPTVFRRSFLRYSDRHSHHTHFISTILRLSFLPYQFHPYHTLTFIPPKIYRPGWKPL